MSNSQRRKGQAGEREVIALFAEELGVNLHRNLQQVTGQAQWDLNFHDCYIEVKRRAKGGNPAPWLEQCERATPEGGRSFLMSRVDRKGWLAHMREREFNRLCALANWQLDKGANGLTYNDELKAARFTRSFKRESYPLQWIEAVSTVWAGFRCFCFSQSTDIVHMTASNFFYLLREAGYGKEAI